MKIVFTLSYVVLFLLCSCSVFKLTTYEPEDKPDWVNRKPQIPNYYVGVSSAAKSGYLPGEYIQSAQQRALVDLAESISVNIESSSVLSIIETNYHISENFSVDIVATTQQNLEGFELVDSWEDENNYWVYYRLCKQKYNEIKAERKKNAIKSALSKYQQAEELFELNNHHNGFQFYTEALAELQPFLNESTSTEVNGERVDLGNFIFSQMIRFLNNIEIYHPESEIRVKRGVDIEQDMVTFLIKDQNGNPVAYFPFRISFTGGGLLRNLYNSNPEGQITCALRSVSSFNNSETLSLRLDLQNLSRLTSNRIIRNIVRSSMPSNEKSINVVIEKPAVFLTSIEKELGYNKTNKNLKNAIKNNIVGYYDIVDNSENADFIIEIESNFSEKGSYQNEYHVSISFRINMKNNTGKNIYRRTIENNFVGSSYKIASNSAYREMEKTIERVISNEIARAAN